MGHSYRAAICLWVHQLLIPHGESQIKTPPLALSVISGLVCVHTRPTNCFALVSLVLGCHTHMAYQVRSTAHPLSCGCIFKCDMHCPIRLRTLQTYVTVVVFPVNTMFLGMSDHHTRPHSISYYYIRKAQTRPRRWMLNHLEGERVVVSYILSPCQEPTCLVRTNLSLRATTYICPASRSYAMMWHDGYGGYCGEMHK